MEYCCLKEEVYPWLVWLSGLSTCLRTERSLVRSPVRAHAWVAGQVAGWESVGSSLIDVSLSLSFSLLSLVFECK